MFDVDVDIASDKNNEQKKDCEDNNVDGEDAMGDMGDEGAIGDEDDEGVTGDEGDEDESDEDAKGDQDDDEGDEDSESEDDDGDDKSYIDKDKAVLSSGPSAIFDCTIRYMDLTCLNLRHFNRVSRVLLIRDEWDAVVDIFNQREIGIEGSAILTGQLGSGKHHYSSWISGCKLITP